MYPLCSCVHLSEDKTKSPPSLHLCGYMWMLAVIGAIILLVFSYECTRTWTSKRRVVCSDLQEEKPFYPLHTLDLYFYTMWILTWWRNDWTKTPNMYCSRFCPSKSTFFFFLFLSGGGKTTLYNQNSGGFVTGHWKCDCDLNWFPCFIRVYFLKLLVPFYFTDFFKTCGDKEQKL